MGCNFNFTCCIYTIVSHYYLICANIINSKKINEVDISFIKSKDGNTTGLRLVNKSDTQTSLSNFNLLQAKYMLDLRIIDPDKYEKPTIKDKQPYHIFIYEMGEVIEYQKKTDTRNEQFVFMFSKPLKSQ